jgi:hypothetical protein
MTIWRAWIGEIIKMDLKEKEYQNIDYSTGLGCDTLSGFLEHGKFIYYFIHLFI